jgi:hypothetical protein
VYSLNDQIYSYSGESFVEIVIINDLFNCQKMKKKQYHTVRTVPIFNRIILERGKIATPNTQIHDWSLSWLIVMSQLYLIQAM